MASAFGHALAAYTIGRSYSTQTQTWKFFSLGIFCAILPDADVISFALGIPYEAFWGHRGFTHSLLFALMVGLLVSVLFFRKQLSHAYGLDYISYFTLCTASHALLDALTNGGLGVALWLPWDDGRFFFPWRPIQVSPIGIENFIGERAVRVLLSELLWIGLPSLFWLGTVYYMKKVRKQTGKQH